MQYPHWPKKTYVLEKKSHKPIENVLIVFSKNKGRVSGPAGDFTLPDSVRSIRLHKLGYIDLRISDFKHGDTLWMEPDITSLNEIEVSTDALNVRDLLKRVLEKSHSLYFQQSKDYFIPYTYTERFLINDIQEYSVHLPKAYFNAFGTTVFSGGRAFTNCYFLPQDSIIARLNLENEDLIRGESAYYFFKNKIPIIPSVQKTLLHKKNLHTLHFNDEGNVIRIDSIEKWGVGREAHLIFDNTDSLAQQYNTRITYCTPKYYKQTQIGVNIFYKDYTHPFVTSSVFIEFGFRNEKYVLTALQFVEEQHFVHKKTEELFIVKHKAELKILEGSGMEKEELISAEAVSFGGGVDLKYVQHYFKKGYEE